MDIGKAYGTDQNLEENGVWIKLDGDAKILVARFGNRKMKEYSSNALLKRVGRAQKVPEDVTQDVMYEAMAHCVLLDWENIELDGKKLKYSPENAKKLLTEYKDFFSVVFEVSRTMETFRAEETDDAVKN